MSVPRLVVALIIIALAAVSSCFAACGDSASFDSPYGINVHAPQGLQLTRVLDEVQNAGLGWIRIDFVWAWTEPSQNSFSWSIYDAIVAAATARNLQIFATIGSTPAWATSGTPEKGVPNSAADWYDICHRAAQRYDGTRGYGLISHWGMWNEPNLTDFWEGSRQQYIDLILKNGADAIKAGNPNAKVIGPELAHMSGSGRDWFYWLKDCIEQAGDKIDILTHHTYGTPYTKVRDRWEKSTSFGGSPSWWGTFEPSFKEVLQYCGWFTTGKPIWITEVGWQSGDVGEAAQASYYSELLNDWFTGDPNRSWINKIFFYEMYDHTAFPYTWGIVCVDAADNITCRKQAYWAYKDFVTAHPSLPSAPCQAINPSPPNMATGLNTTVTLAWTAGKGAASHKIYFGTANPPPYRTEQTQTTYQPGVLNFGTTYYWRIDEVNSGGTTTGTVWRFTTTSDTQPSSVPSNVQATALSAASIQVTWNASTDNIGVSGYKIFRDGAQVGTTAATSYIDSALSPATTYSYRVSAYDALGNESAKSSTAVATTMETGLVIFQESFLSDPFVDRWSKDLGTPGVDKGEIVYSDKNGVNDPQGLSLDGHVYYSNVALGPQQMTYLGQFTTAGWTNPRLSFYIRNGGTAGGSLTCQVKDSAGVWQTAWSQTNLPDYAGWTKIEAPLSGTVTGVRVHFDVARTRLDEIVIEGTDNTAPTPGIASSPAYAGGPSITVNYSGAGDTGSGLLRTWLWYKKDAGAWQSSGLSSTTASGSFAFGSGNGLTGDGTYYFAMRAEDNAGNWSAVPSGSGNTSTIYDGSPPDLPLVVDDGIYTISNNSIHASWSSEDLGSGIAEYQYAVSTTKMESGIISGGGWQSAGVATQAIRTGLLLTYGGKYYVLVKARNGAGLWSEVASSDGIVIVENPGLTVGEAKLLPNGASVGIDEKTVTALFDDSFYIWGADRACGIQVIADELPESLRVGSTVTIAGTMQTVSHERSIDAESVIVLADGS